MIELISLLLYILCFSASAALLSIGIKKSSRLLRVIAILLPILLVGSGHGESEIKKKVAQLKLEENVKFLGLRSDIASIMQAMDVFVMPSRFEGLPVVSIEAQASGLPCVFSDVVTTSLDITGNCKFISLDDTPEQWAAAISESMDSKRTDTQDSITRHGYDVTHESLNLMNVYLGLVV